MHDFEQAGDEQEYEADDDRGDHDLEDRVCAQRSSALSSRSLTLLLSVTRSSHKVMAIAIVMYQGFLTSGMYPSVTALNAAPHDLMTCMVLAGRRMVEPGTYHWHEPFHAR